MKINRDEARILGMALQEFRFTFAEENRNLAMVPDREEAHQAIFKSLSNLLRRLEDEGKDQRRTGRTTMDDEQDLARRIAKAYLKSLNH